MLVINFFLICSCKRSLMRLIYIFILLFSISNYSLLAQQINSIPTNVNNDLSDTTFKFKNQLPFKIAPVNIDNNFSDTKIEYKWNIGLSIGLNEVRGFLNNYVIFDSKYLDPGFNIRLSRQMFKKHLLTINFNKVNLNYTFLNTSNNKNPNVYNPYKLYENNGYSMFAEIFEINLKSSINLESVINFDINNLLNNFFYNSSFKNIDLYFDLGLGLSKFASIYRNLNSNTYIYAFGYNDLEGDFEESKDLCCDKNNNNFSWPTAGIITISKTLKYELIKNIYFNFAWEEKIIHTDMLNGIDSNSKNDRYRSLFFGLDYLF